MPVGSYSTNPALNTSISGIDISEGSAASGYNDALRQIMADIATWIATQAVSLPVSVANGGTGATTAPAALTALGALASSYRDLAPINLNGSFTFSDAGCGAGVLWTGSTGTGTINPHATTNVKVGGVVPVFNNGSGVLTVSPGAGVSLLKNGSTGSGSAALAVGAVATLVQWTADNWTITGVGVS